MGAEVLCVDGRATGWEVRSANGMLERARGLLWSGCRQHSVLAIHPCCAVHTLGMRYPIDVIFTDSRARVIRIVPALRPWRAASALGSTTAWEGPSGTAALLQVRIGSRVEARPR